MMWYSTETVMALHKARMADQQRQTIRSRRRALRVPDVPAEVTMKLRAALAR